MQDRNKAIPDAVDRANRKANLHGGFVNRATAEDGIEDGALVTEGTGQTLPLADTIYNSLEVGISATGVASELFVDDIEVSDKALK